MKEAVDSSTKYEALRDVLYSKMRGARFGTRETPQAMAAAEEDVALELLTEIRDEIRALRGRFGGASE